jgi:RNA polymerase sigma factor (sigma-70 family)
MKRLPELRETYLGNPSSYIHGMAKKVLFEYRRRRSNIVELEASVSGNPNTTDFENEKMYGCLELCLSNLSAPSRELILDYYSEEYTRNRSSRKDLAEKLGVSLSQLRVRMYRTRRTLETCVKSCMEQAGTI